MAEPPLSTAAKRVEHDLPTGVVTFLFTDIEGSTRMLEEHRSEAGDAFGRHHELLRGAIEDASGVESSSRTRRRLGRGAALRRHRARGRSDTASSPRRTSWTPSCASAADSTGCRSGWSSRHRASGQLAAHGASSRFRLLEPIRQYGEERLAEAGESDAATQAHARHYAAFVAVAAPYTRGAEQMAWERRLDADYDNVGSPSTRYSSRAPPTAISTWASTSSSSMPLLPMQEMHRPRMLDAAAEVLLAAGLVEQAAVALGRAESTELPVPTIFAREPRLEAVGEKLVSRLGEGEPGRLRAEGAALGVDEALAQIRGWLRAR